MLEWRRDIRVGTSGRQSVAGITIPGPPQYVKKNPKYLHIWTDMRSDFAYASPRAVRAALDLVRWELELLASDPGG